MQNTFLLRQKMPVVRTATIIAVPALASLIGILWFRRRKRSKVIVVSPEKPSLSTEIERQADQCKIKECLEPNVENSVCQTVAIVEECCAVDFSLQNSEEKNIVFLLPESDLSILDCDRSAECTDSCISSITDCVTNRLSFDDSEGVMNEMIDQLNCLQVTDGDCLTISCSSGTQSTDDCGKITSADTNADMLSQDSGHSGSNDVFGVDIYQSYTYQFYFPTELCGMLIGKDGRNINGISRRSGADISVRVQPDFDHLQLVSIDGTESQVNRAVCAIQQRFPENLFPHISYENINAKISSNVEPVNIQLTQLFLAEDCAVDILVSSVVGPDHVFVQQPNSDTFRFLQMQDCLMQACYSQSVTGVPLPRPVLENTLCAAPMFNGWFRAMVISYYSDCDDCLIRFVDYGGYARVAAQLLQQIRSDFTSLPFQAIECYLTDIVSPIDDLPYPDEAKILLEQLVQSQPLVAQVVGYTEDNITCINVFHYGSDGQLYNTTEELVVRGLARRVCQTDDTQSQVF